jgi:hypothetical protein
VVDETCERAGQNAEAAHPAVVGLESHRRESIQSVVGIVRFGVEGPEGIPLIQEIDKLFGGCGIQPSGA